MSDTPTSEELTTMHMMISAYKDMDDQAAVEYLRAHVARENARLREVGQGLRDALDEAIDQLPIYVTGKDDDEPEYGDELRKFVTAWDEVVRGPSKE